MTIPFSCLAIAFLLAYAAKIPVAGGGNGHTAGLLAITYDALHIGNISSLRTRVWTVGFVATLGLCLLPVL